MGRISSLIILTSLVVFISQANFAEAGNITALKEYADATWNCAGGRPPCPSCDKRVPSGSGQSPYGCAPYVAHCLAAGGFINLDPCGTIDQYSNVHYNGQTYDLNVVSHQDGNCGGLCLIDYLLARGWVQASSVSAGTVCAVTGSDGPFTHIVIGVGRGIVNAHNMAHFHVPIDNYTVNQCVNPTN